MKDRIQVDGVWYVREFSTPPQSVIEDVEDICFEYSGILYEDQVMVLDATRIGNNGLVSSIVYTDKTTKPWQEDRIDNEGWLMNILDNQPEAIKVFKETFKNQHEQEVFKAFLLKLRAMGWL